MWEHTGGWGMGWIGVGLFHMVVFWGVLIFLVLALVRGLGNGKSGNEKSALGLLRERYARGELDRDEFERMRREIAE